MSGRTRLIGGIVSCFLLTACGGGSSGPAAPDSSGSLRPGLTVTVIPDASAAATAAALGWSGGIEGAEVRIHRIGDEFAWQVAFTDAEGKVEFPRAVGGEYRVAASRPLTASERAIAGGNVRVLADGLKFRVTGGSGEVTLRAAPNRPAGLLISEIYAVGPRNAEVNYNFHQFIELYNNSDETVFLDGIVFGIMEVSQNQFAGNGLTCAASEPFRNDPTGVWTRHLHQIPGSGGEHPLLPGERAVLARDAVDHSAIDGRFPDLSNADFEFIGAGDVDNPAVPNMPEVGIRVFSGPHGLVFWILHVMFIAEPLDVNSLERDVFRAPQGDFDIVRIPADKLIDVVATEQIDPEGEQTAPPCPNPVHPNFDRLEGGFIEHFEELTFSMQRLVAGDANGRDVLQDTNTSAVDFIKADHTPGR